MATIASEWRLNPGDTIERVRLHEEYGGRTQGGIGPSKLTPNVLIFSDAASGEKHGYFDGWQADGAFHYSGEGQFGDQRMVSGNRSILDHVADGRALRVFRGARGTVRYVDEFELDSAEPYYETDAPESEVAGRTRQIRKVIVFRLRPKTVKPGPPGARLAEALSGPAVASVPLEERWTEKAFVDPSGQSYEADRRESKLVADFVGELQARGHVVYRFKIVPNGERKPIFPDAYDENADLLVEAKGAVTREGVRMAIGQLADYHRFRPDATRALLVPSRPREDLEALLRSQGIAVIWKAETGFESTNPDVLGGSV